MKKKRLAILLCLLMIFNNASCTVENTQTLDTNQSEIIVSQTEAEDDTRVESSAIVSKETDEWHTTESEPIAETVQTESKTDTPPVESTKSETVSSEHYTKETVTLSDSVESEPVNEEIPVVQPVIRADAKDVEVLTAKYINELRNSQGDTSATVLLGLTEVARYRANQLIINFDHVDIREVCGELKYGTYYDMTQYGMDTSYNYYEGYDREAIAKGNWGGTADEIAKNIVTGFKNSTKHWEYVGDSKYTYMAVGAIYNEATNMWYVCICMSSKNYGG